MRVYPFNGLESIEYNKIKEHLASFTSVGLVKELIAELKPVSNLNQIQLELSQTAEYVQTLEDGELFPSTHFRSLHAAIKQLENEYGVLNEEHFHEIRNQAHSINRLIDFLEQRATQYPALFDLVYGLEEQHELIKLIDSVFDKKGVIKDNASKKLAEIRRELDKIRKEVNRRFERVLTKMKKAGYLRDFEESYYHGRRVLAVTSEYKRIVKGKIKGTSETQSTTFIEPTTNILLNEEIDDLIDEEKREIFKILRQLTHRIRGHVHAIKINQDVLKWFEFTRTKSKFAREINACKPRISQDQNIEIKEAYHPLLYLLAKENNKKIVPLDLEQDDESRIVVISGPNAGGKSIALKSCGLLQMMLQSGLLVPVNPDSKFRLFSSLLVDLGDTQSIEFELSTYSSRLTKMKDFIEFADANTLVLMDEFGTGSDPDLGGAIAEVVLEKIADKKAFGIVTTHYNNIKLKAEEYEGLQNACMLFDTQTLAPKYILKQGQAGSSYTFEVATTVGLPEEIIQESRARANSDKLQYDKVLTEYQDRLEQLKSEIEELKEREREFETLTELTEARKSELEDRLKEDKSESVERNKLIGRGKFLDDLLQDFEKSKNKKQLLDKLLKRYNAEKIKQLEEKKSALARQKQENERKKRAERRRRKKIPPKPLKEGDKVRMAQGGKQTGIIDKIEKDKAHVTFGFVKSIVELKKLRAIVQAT